MRIGVNLLFLVPGEVGGSEPLLTNLVRAVAASAGESGHELVVFAVRGFGRAYPEIRDTTELVEAPWPSLPKVTQGIRIAAEHTWLPLQARLKGLDMIHHGVGTTPFLKLLPTVVTIHDVQYLHYPANFTKLKRAWLRLNVPQAARRSEIVAVTSHFVERDIVEGYGVDPRRVAIVPFGSERLFGPHPDGADAVREHYRLERPYFIFPGRSYPHKNHHLLIEAYAPLAGNADLVLTGPRWFLDPEIATAVRNLGLMGKVRHLGLVPRAHLAGLYEGAIALVYPSRFEGFGAPVLEAWSVGCPVISSNAAALPEVVGDAGILLESDDLEGWTQTMDTVLSNPRLRDELAALGTKRSAEFSWERAADAQLAAYEHAHALGASRE
jgi:glycosyltransferase involved in cell wall biosynthesis